MRVLWGCGGYCTGRQPPSLPLPPSCSFYHSLLFFLFTRTFAQKVFSSLNILFSSPCALCPELLRVNILLIFVLLMLSRVPGLGSVLRKRLLNECVSSPYWSRATQGTAWGTWWPPLPVLWGPSTLHAEGASGVQSPKEADVFLGFSKVKQSFKSKLFLLNWQKIW